MRVVIEKIEGVQSVRVSLKEGIATIQLAPTNRVTVAKIREAIRSNGFAAREANVRLAGSLVHRGGGIALVVPTTGEVFALEEGPGSMGTLADLRRRGQGTSVVLTGKLPNPVARREQGPERMLVYSVAPAPTRSP